MADFIFLPARLHFCVPNGDHCIFRRGKIVPRNQLRSRRCFLRFAIHASSLDEPAEKGRRSRRRKVLFWINFLSVSNKQIFKKKREKVDIPIIADTNHALSKAFGVLKKDEGIPYRGLFIIDNNVKTNFKKSKTEK